MSVTAEDIARWRAALEEIDNRIVLSQRDDALERLRRLDAEMFEKWVDALRSEVK